MGQLANVDWTIGDFLYYLFCTVDDDGSPVSHPKPLETSLSQFLSGRTLQKPINIVQLWHNHPYSNPATTTENHEPHYSFTSTYLEVKHAKAAITSMVVQLCEKVLLREVQEAVKGLFFFFSHQKLSFCCHNFCYMIDSVSTERPDNMTTIPNSIADLKARGPQVDLACGEGPHWSGVARFRNF